MDWIIKPWGMVVVTGAPGVGKTYTSAAVINAMESRDALRRKGINSVRYWTEYDLLQRIRDSIDGGEKGGGYIQVLKYLTDDDLIFLDDLGATGHTDWREEILYTFLNQQWEDARPTFITSNLDQKQIRSTYHPRIASRLFDKQNIVIHMTGQDQRMV